MPFVLKTNYELIIYPFHVDQTFTNPSCSWFCILSKDYLYIWNTGIDCLSFLQHFNQENCIFCFTKILHMPWLIVIRALFITMLIFIFIKWLIKLTGICTWFLWQRYKGWSTDVFWYFTTLVYLDWYLNNDSNPQGIYC